MKANRKQRRQLEKVNKSLPVAPDPEMVELEIRKRLQNFSKLLNKDPQQANVRKNPYANNSKYLPISFVEMKLDELFFGLWQTENFKTQVVMNEIVGSIDLLIFHPTANAWLRRTGSAAVQVQMKSGSGVLDAENKIKNTLTKDYPHLKAECLKNAARSLGKAFGRDLNRDFEDSYSPIPLVKRERLGQELYNKIINKLHNSNLDDEQKAHFEREADWFSETEAYDLLTWLDDCQMENLDEQLDNKIKNDDNT